MICRLVSRCDEATDHAGHLIEASPTAGENLLMPENKLLRQMWNGMDTSKDGAVILSEFTAAQRSKEMKFDTTDVGKGDFFAVSGGKSSFSKRDFFAHYAIDDFTSTDKDQDGYDQFLTQTLLAERDASCFSSQVHIVRRVQQNKWLYERIV
jgi:hypothetical protein